MKNKRILITGGAGFIGSMLISYLKNFKYEIFVIDNLSFGKMSHINIPEDHFFKADIRDKIKIKTIVNKIKPNFIIHLAAIHFIPYCNEHEYETFATNVEGTMHVLDAAMESKPEKVLFASTAAVYSPSNTAMKETDSIGPTDVYGLSKLTGEYLCKKFFNETGIDTIVCRFFNAFGPNETNPHVIPSIQQQINAGSRILRLGNITPKRDFIHTFDISEALYRLLNYEAKNFEIFNIGSGTEYSVKDIVEVFSRLIKEEIIIEIDQTRVRKVERMHLLADNTKLKLLGWNPKISIDEGLRTLINTISDNNKLFNIPSKSFLQKEAVG